MKKRYIETILNNSVTSFLNDNASEIRIRINMPAVIIYPDREVITDVVYKRKDIDELMDRITKSSPYTFSEDIKNGFITIFGGHRIGICGTAVYENGVITNIKDISYINIRLASELIGISEGLFSKIRNGNDITDTLIISPPGGGKTTMLRDLIRLISDNIPKKRISVIDERNEISASFMGEAQNNIGKRTDVLCGYNKKDGISRAVRCMSPDLVALDEIGGKEDCDAILWLKHSGVKVIATMHGENICDVKRNIMPLISNKVFGYYVFLNREKRECSILTYGELYD